MDTVDIGKECFAAADGSVISYKGENYYPRENEGAPAPVELRRDEKDRVIPQDMTDREIQVETLQHLRNLNDILEGLAANPMVAAMVKR